MRPRVPQAARSPLQARLNRISLPSDFSPEQASAIFEIVDALRDRLWLLYGPQIQQLMREDRSRAPACQPEQTHDGDPPF